MTAAYLLKRTGKRVCLLERDRSAGWTPGTRPRISRTSPTCGCTSWSERSGDDACPGRLGGGAAAINQIDEIVRGEEIDCEFRRVPGYLHAALGGCEKDESAALCQRTPELARSWALRRRLPGVGAACRQAGVRFANQAKFHP